ncbi:bifunctional uridylate/adenylate kinase [Xanthoria parietina]
MGVPDVVPLNLQIVFVLGGPGAGKGTQCTRLAQDYYLQHLSLGDVLRKERDTPGSEYGELIARNMEQGRIGPMEVTVSLLRKAILASTVQTNSRLFLIDGFPRKMDQLHLFEDTVCAATCAVYLDTSSGDRRRRLINRAVTDGRQDDTDEIIQKRFVTFEETCMKVIKHLECEGRIEKVQGEGNIDEVYVAIQQALKTRLGDALASRKAVPPRSTTPETSSTTMMESRI